MPSSMEPLHLVIARDFLRDNFWHVALAAKTLGIDDFVETHYQLVRGHFDALGVRLTEDECRDAAGSAWAMVRGH